MQFRNLTKRTAKRVVALTAAAVLTVCAILPHMQVLPYASNCPENKTHEWTGLKLQWTDIKDATEGTMLWPRKLYLDGGNGIYKGMDNSYCYCIANHTRQP